MGDVVVRATWRSKEQAGQHLNGVVLPFCREQIAAGHVLDVEIRLHEDNKSNRQKGYYHEVILKEISQQAAPMGCKHGLSVWKEFFRAEFLGHKTQTCINPVTGKKSRRRVRVSTEDLGVKGYAQLIDRVSSYAVMEFGVRFSMDFQQYSAWVDRETGEILSR